MTDRLDAVLSDAAAAARTRAADGVDDGAATRLRVRESIAGGRTSRSRRKLLTIITAVIASLFGSFAFAAYVAGWNPLAPAAPVEEPVAAPPVENIAKPPRAKEPAPAPIVAEPLQIDVEPPPEATVEKPKPRPTVKQPARPVVVEHVPAVEPPKPDGLAAYRVAHEAHFRGNDPAAALAAWDTFLDNHPGHQLAPEARYNRALVLIKLQRYADARQALAPFASAPPGSYRQAEAAKLLAALPK